MSNKFTLVNQIDKGGNYPVDIVYNEHQTNLISIPLADGTIEIMDLNTMQSTSVSTSQVISGCKFDNSNLLWVSSKDGFLRLFDLRTSSVAMKHSAGLPILSFDLNADHSMLAAGTEMGSEATIAFWDNRYGGQLANFVEWYICFDQSF